MKKYSKGRMKLKRLMVVFAGLLVLMLISGIVLLFAFCFKDTITKVEISNVANEVSEDVAQNSLPIVIDNLVVGALYNNRWVSANKYWLKGTNKTDIDVAVYSLEDRAGKYKIRDVYTEADSVFVNTSYPNYIDEYFATSVLDKYALSSQFVEVNVLDSDFSNAKKALGIYRLYNDSVSISKVYAGYVDANTPVRILAVNNSTRGAFGGIYSAIIAVFPNNNKAKIVAYSYTKDLVNTDEFPLHSVELMADLNGDDKCELITRSVTEFTASYNVFEYQNGKFVLVLTEKLKSK